MLKLCANCQNGWLRALYAYNVYLDFYMNVDGWMRKDGNKETMGSAAEQCNGRWRGTKSWLLGFFKFCPELCHCHWASLVCVWEPVAGSYLNKWTSGLKADEQNVGDAHGVMLLRVPGFVRRMSGELFNKWFRLPAWSHTGDDHTRWDHVFFLETAFWFLEDNLPKVKWQ